MLKNHFFKSFICTLAVITALISFTVFVKAETKGEGLTISPPITELTLDSGKSVMKTIRLTNPTGKIVEVYPKVMNFKAKGEGGEPAFFEKSEEESKFSLASWIAFSANKIALAPEQVVEFSYDITVPEKAETGGHYGVVFFASEPPKAEEDSSKVSIGSMIGSLILVKVPGQITEKGFLESFQSEKTTYANPKVNLITRISNLGNVHFKPRGTIVIKNQSGKVVDTLNFNEQSGNVLPDSTRKFENLWEKKGLLIGKYSAELKLTYGENEKTLEGKTAFWILPPLVTFPALGIVLGIVSFVLARTIRGKKRRKGSFKDPDIYQGGDNNRIILR